MKKQICLLLSAAMILGLTACSQNPNQSASVSSTTTVAETGGTDGESKAELTGSGLTFTPGTYEGTAAGRNGDITVEVVVSEDAINSVTVVEHQETPGVADPALKQIPSEIVKYQSLGVDAVSGATVTSVGIIEAVAAATEKAGVDVAMLRNVPVDRKTTAAEDMTTQVVVAGGGMSGIMAALTAANHGADVILVEKQAALGGSAITSAGGAVTANSELVPEDMDDSVERVIEWTRRMNETSVRQPDYDYLTAILSETGKTIDYISEEFGLTPEFEDRGDYIRSRYGSGRNLITGLADHLEENGATVLLNSSAEEILMDGDQAVGLKVKGEGGEFTIHADKVIIATGGANGDKELMLEKNPELKTINLIDTANAGNTGDGFRMLEEIGAQMGDGPYIKSSSVLMRVNGQWPSAADRLLVDGEGNRFCNESPMFATMLNTYLLRQASPAYYVLFDEQNTEAQLLEALKETAEENDSGKVVYGATLEELAEKLQIPSETLRATFDRYQEMCANGEDTDFGKDASHLIPYANEGGYYAACAYPGSWGTFGGAITDEEFHVLREDGSLIGNVFAVGECATSEFFGDYYQGAFSLGLYSTAGRIAGETAVEEINAR